MSTDRSMDRASADLEKGSPERTPSRGELDRTASNRLQHTTSVASQALSVIRARGPRPEFTIPEGVAAEKTPDAYIVTFEGPDDPYRPMNWPLKKKIITTLLYGMTTMTATFASAIFSPAQDQVSDEFQVGAEVSTLGTSLMLLGFAFGPLLFAPLSELYGRKQAVLLPTVASMVFSFGAGAGKDIQTVIICRFFQGFFGSAPVTNTGGVLGDIWSPEVRGAAIVGYAIAVIGGPTLGPIVGGAIVLKTSWRWVQYVSGLFTAVVLILDYLILDESFPNALLVRKAQRLRHTTGIWGLHAKHEEWDVSLKELCVKYLIRPFQLMFTPICFIVALYASFVYGLFYASLGAFPFVFEHLRGWNKLVGALPFLAMLVGVLLSIVVNLANQGFYTRRWKANNYRAVPEARLPPMMFGSFIFAGGVFMFGWSAPPDVFWLVPCIGIVLMGLGFVTIFQAAVNYLIDTFQSYAASAVAANTFLRSVLAAAFPLFIEQMLSRMGVQWGISVFGFIAVALIPVPYVFWIYGKRIRAAGHWSKESAMD